MKKDILENGNTIIQHLNRHNFAAFFVGGCVRDLLLKRSVGDIDIVTEALPEDIMEIFPKTIPLGINHGTVIIRHKGHSYEVSTFRFPEQVRIDDDHSKNEQIQLLLYNDLKHRDFTINAIAMDRHGKIIDPFKGREDLEQQTIKMVNNDTERLKEDPLRIMRAFRFVSELGFQIDSHTMNLIASTNELLESVAMERMSQEFSKLIKGDYITDSFKHIIAADTVKYLPVLKNNPDLLIHLQQRIKPLHSLSEFFTLINYLDKQLSIKNFVKTWKCSRRIAQESDKLFTALCDFKQYGLNPWLVYQLGKERFAAFLRLLATLYRDPPVSPTELTTIYNKLTIYSAADIAFTGKHLKGLFPQRQPGIWMKQTLYNIEKQIVNEQLENNLTKIKEWVQCHPPEVD